MQNLMPSWQFLELTIVAEYYDMIEAGIKKEEYRQIKKHWIQRLVTNKFTRTDYRQEHDVISLIRNNADYYTNNKMRKFNFVIFKNGYHKNTRKMIFEFLGIEIGKGNPEWGAIENEICFKIKLGDKLD